MQAKDKKISRRRFLEALGIGGLGLTALVSGCSGIRKIKNHKEEGIIPISECDGQPDWYGKDGLEDNHVWGYGIGEALGKAEAQKEAEEMARADLYGKLTGHIPQTEKNLDEVQVFGAGLKGKIYFCEYNGRQRVYRGLAAPVGEAANTARVKIERNIGQYETPKPSTQETVPTISQPPPAVQDSSKISPNPAISDSPPR